MYRHLGIFLIVYDIINLPMPSKNSVNNKEVLKDLEKKISPVLVVNNSSLKPYVELFDYAPENIYQQPLGSLVGFFEVKEYSDDSAYVVNFLTSVLKKEYYINPKRPVTESLDSALHKVNMALSELAKHGNIEWLGKLNAAICVLEKNNTHFSVAGNAKIFLYRKLGLTEISEDLASDSSEPHPLKTFVNVSSGRLEKDDRLLITSADIFHIFSTIELKKNFQRFEGEKFVQFLKTALSNQMEMIASVVIEMCEIEPIITPKNVADKKPLRTANVFSETTFAEIPAKDLPAPESMTIINTPESDIEYTDQKTGHIYVQGEATEPSENPKASLYWDSAKEKLGEGWYLTKNETRRRFSLYKKQIAKKIEQRRLEKQRQAELKEEEETRIREEIALHEIELEKQLAEQQETERILSEKRELEIREAEIIEQQKLAEHQQEQENQRKLAEKQELAKQRLLARQSKITKTTEAVAEPAQEDTQRELSFQEKLQRAVKEQQRQAVIDLRTPQKTNASQSQAIEDNETTLSVPIHLQTEIEELKKQERNEAVKTTANKIVTEVKHFFESAFEFAKKQTAAFIEKRKVNSMDENRAHIIPRFSKIKTTYSRFSLKQKLYAVGILAFIFIVPIFIARYLDKPKQATINELQAIPTAQTTPLSEEKNMKASTEKQTLLPRTDLTVGTIISNVGVATFTKNSVLISDGNAQFKEHPLPENQGSIVNAAFMNDLSLILIMTDQNKVISFSPISLKFADNNINLSGKAQGSFIGTYLTYLYVLDSDANQIYRYPRADGGFGEKTNWLKAEASLSETSSMTIDDSIYLVQNNKVMKFFKGQPQALKLEDSQTAINFDQIYTTIDSDSLYVLDIENARLIQFAKDGGSIISQHYNEDLKNGSSLTVDEKNKAAYITTSEGLISISL